MRIPRGIVVLSALVLVQMPDGARAEDAASPLRFANLFNSNMVLQQGKPAAVWGWAAPGSALTVMMEEYDEPLKPAGDVPAEIAYVEHGRAAFEARTLQSVAAEDGTWRATFPAMPASFRSKRITVRDPDGHSAQIDNVLVGEVWVCSGQSNMVWTGALNKDLWMGGLHLSGIRYTKYDFAWYRPLSDLPEKVDWNVTSRESLQHFSAVAYVFARHLHLNLGVPVGIINNARGGTLGMSWTSREALQALDAPVVVEQLAEYDAQSREWETEEYLQRLARAQAELVNVWRPKAKEAIAAWWVEQGRFMAQHLDQQRYAEWRQIATDWHGAQQRG